MNNFKIKVTVFVASLLTVVALVLGAGPTRAKVPGNPGTPSGFASVYDPDLEQMVLCWYGMNQFRGLGNCMDLPTVFDILKKGEKAYTDSQVNSTS